MTDRLLPARLRSGVELETRQGLTPELRDPTAATKQLYYRGPGQAQVQDWNADQAFRFGYAANVIAYRCIQLRANAIASAPIKVGRNGKHNPNAPLARLLSPPELGGRGAAPKLSARKLIRWTIGQEIVTGRRAWEIETADGKEDGRPVALWPLVISQLREVPSEGGTEWFSVFRYGPEHKRINLPPGRVFYGWDPSGTDFRKAESAIGAGRYDLSLITLCDRYGMAFLKNNATPAAVITTAAFPTEADRWRFRQQWASEFEGVDNAGRAHFNEVDPNGEGPVGDAIDVRVLGLSARDSQLVETRAEAVRELAIALGVPFSKLDASGRTFDNADSEDRDFWENTVLPDLTDLQDDINTMLAPRLGDDVAWFDTSHIRALRPRITPISAAVGVPSLVMGRLITIDEARADYGLDPLPDGTGDRLMTFEEIARLRTGDLTIETLTPSTGPTSPTTDPEPDEDDEEPAEEEPPAERTDPEPEQREPERNGPTPEEVEQRRVRIWRATDAVVTQIERRWERSMRRLFKRQLDATVSRLTGKRGRQALGYTTEGVPDGERAEGEPVDAASIFDVAFWTAATAEVSVDLFEQAMGAGLDRVALLFGVDFDTAMPGVADAITSRANQLAGQVTQTTYDSIVDQLAQGVGDGESIDELAERVRHVFSVADETRAERIARTEVISAYNGAANRAAIELPADVMAGREWIATRDGRTRPAHASIDGQIALGHEPFVVAGSAAEYPGDPSLPPSQTVNCRCAVAFLTPEDVTEMGRSPRQIDQRTASALMSMVPWGDDVDLIRFRRALEGAA